ncbi:MAG: hypothetical protein ACNI28_10960 [Arcobacter sp.]|uniref:hypothetical protein n=1 Tax=Arcobacter sp. TaxID=1872629 RepID=UPI003B0008E1
MEQILISLTQNISIADIALILMTAIITIGMLRNNTLGKKLATLFFFTNDDGLKNEKISELEKQMKTLEERLTKNVLKDKEELVHQLLEKYIDDNILDLINKKIQNADVIKDSIIKNLKEDIQNTTKNYLTDTSVKDIQEAIKKDSNHRFLTNTLEKESRNASTLKMVMINLFVIVTFAFVAFNIVKQPDLSSSAYFATLGLYFSLGAFMLYIIRTSHFRSSVLLAIHEDERNYNNLDEYIYKHKNNEDITEHDVDVIRMIMTNRSEREQKANHPYEVILKGVSGTNVQFKGGKIALGDNNNSKKT